MENRISLGAKSRYSLDLETLEIIENDGKLKVSELKEQPIFTIAGTDFYVEIYSQTLIEVADPKNYLPVRDMTDMGDRYKFLYHPTYKNWPCELDDPKESFDVEVPYLIKLDPEGIARKHNIDPKELKGRKDIEFLNPNYQGFLARRAGKLPAIDIAGEQYFVDLENRQLVLKENAFHQLKFEDFQEGCPLSDDFSYRFAYDRQSRKVIASGDLQAKQAIIVELPYKVSLDPVGLARQLGFSDDHYIREYPIEKHLVAKVSNIKGANIPNEVDNSERKIRNRKKGFGL
ncbi:hypothetical protein [Flavobacterium lindanitolerans]|uniref:hypothetical protein n=1 Tax=Flavobacterium lindanitolerans TaxID=428988 RepID=UPI0023F4E184|nr:hypothetical protein [Flavobacterium lindanitolerans]